MGRGAARHSLRAGALLRPALAAAAAVAAAAAADAPAADADASTAPALAAAAGGGQEGAVVGEHVPNELPGPGFPGPTAAASNAAWPSGHQPARLAAWPQTGAGTAKPTLHVCWKKTVLHDVDKGWPDVCLNLFHAISRADLAQCKATCWGEPRCAVWQYNKVSTGEQCWLGAGTDCANRNGQQGLNFEVLGGQRIQHGDVLVLKNMSGPQVEHLYNLGPFHDGGLESGIERCRGWCYSLISCTYWQYGPTGCWVDAPFLTTQRGMYPGRVVQYPLTTSGLNPQYQMVAGEYIQHYCPPAPVSTSNGPDAGAGAGASAGGGLVAAAPPLPVPSFSGGDVLPDATPDSPTPAPSLVSGSWVWGVLVTVLLCGALAVAGLLHPSKGKEKSRSFSRRSSVSDDEEEYGEGEYDGYRTATEEDCKPLISAAARGFGADGSVRSGREEWSARTSGSYYSSSTGGYTGGSSSAHGGPPTFGPGAFPAEPMHRGGGAGREDGPHVGDQFNMMDSNRDGLISRGDFHQAFQSGSLRLPPSLLQTAANSLSGGQSPQLLPPPEPFPASGGAMQPMGGGYGGMGSMGGLHPPPLLAQGVSQFSPQPPPSPFLV